MANDSEPDHERLVEETKAHLERTGSPRLLLFGLLLATGAAGFFASYGMLAAGVTSMAVRYPLAVWAAYLVFLGLLGIWIRVRRTDDALILSLAERANRPRSSPGAAALLAGRKRRQSSSTSNTGTGWWWWGGSSGGGGDSDGCAVVIVIILILIAVVGAVIACGMVLAEAPTLLAELLVDGAVVAAIAPRRDAEPPHWLGGVLRRTWLKAVTIAVVFSLVGLGLTAVEPKATTMGEAFRMAQADRR